MHKSFIQTIFLLVVFYLFSMSNAFASPIDYDDIINVIEQRRSDIAVVMEESTVFVLNIDRSDPEDVGTGTGFVVAPNYILTNGHVTEDADELYVSGKTLSLRKATLVKEVNDGVNDFSLLKIAATEKFPILPFSTNVRRTERVSAWGYPSIISQFDNKMDDILDGKFDGTPPLVYTEGVVSSFVDNGKAVSIIHSAIIAGGNSGGPLINANGEVIGINSWRSTDVYEGSMVNAALTADSAIAFLRSCGIEPRIAPNGESKKDLKSSLSQASKKQNGNALGPDGIRKSTDNKESKDFAIQGEPQEPAGLSKEMQDAYALAKRGDVAAQTFVGFSLYYGDNAPANPEVGAYWLQKAMVKGSVDAQALYGAIQIADPNYYNAKQGLKNLKDAANKDANHASILAQFLFTGEIFGIERNYDESFHMAKRAAEVNNIDGIALLALFYFHGIGDERDTTKAFKLAQKAAAEEHPLGYAVLAWLYYNGLGVQQDFKKAFEYAKLSADGNEPEGIALLGYFYYQGVGVKENPKLAFMWAKQAADDGNDFGRTLTGFFYAEGYGVKKDEILGVAYLALAMELGFTDAVEQYNTYSKQLTKKKHKQVELLVNTWFNQWGF